MLIAIYGEDNLRNNITAPINVIHLDVARYKLAIFIVHISILLLLPRPPSYLDLRRCISGLSRREITPIPIFNLIREYRRPSRVIARTPRQRVAELENNVSIIDQDWTSQCRLAAGNMYI